MQSRFRADIVPSAGDGLKLCSWAIDPRSGAGKTGRETQDVLGIKKIGLAAETSCHPLPGKKIAGKVAVEQMTIQPAGGQAPIHLAIVNAIAGQPETLVVVQIARLIELSDRGVDDPDARCPNPDVGWQRAEMSCRQRCFVNRLENAVSMFLPGFMEEASPGELRRQLVTQRQAVSEAKVFESLVKRDEPMREVRPEQGDSAVHLVSCGRRAPASHPQVVSGR